MARNHICGVPHLAGEKTEVQKGEITHLRSQGPSDRLTALLFPQLLQRSEWHRPTALLMMTTELDINAERSEREAAGVSRQSVNLVLSLVKAVV